MRNILVMLLAEFLLGMAVNLIGPLAAGHRGATRIGGLLVLGLHEAVGVGLLIAAIVILAPASRSGANAIRYARYGAAATVSAFLTGVATVTAPPPELFSFLMAALGALAATAYVQLYVHTAQLNPTHTP